MEYIFTLQQPYHNVVIVQKDYKGLDLMVVYPWNFTHVKRQPWRRIFFIKILNLFSSCVVHIRCFKKFVSTLWWYNDENFDLLKF